MSNKKSASALFFVLDTADIMKIDHRYFVAMRAAAWHLLLSVVIALGMAAIVFGLWYPYPYREISGGRELFLLITVIDIVCGPLMTFVIFDFKKPRRELRLDLTLVVGLQLVALAYGVWTTWQARPVYLSFERDRFKVVMSADLNPSDVRALPPELAPLKFGGVRMVGLRPPKSTQERNKVLFESIEFGRDYAVRPEFYIPYEGAEAMKALNKGQSLEKFLLRYPDERKKAETIAVKEGVEVGAFKYLPIIGRQDWVALLDKNGMVKGFLKGDGFL